MLGSLGNVGLLSLGSLGNEGLLSLGSLGHLGQTGGKFSKSFGGKGSPTTAWWSIALNLRGACLHHGTIRGLKNDLKWKSKCHAIKMKKNIINHIFENHSYQFKNIKNETYLGSWGGNGHTIPSIRTKDATMVTRHSLAMFKPLAMVLEKIMKMCEFETIFLMGLVASTFLLPDHLTP